MNKIEPWSFTIEETLSTLKTSEEGLTEEEAERRLKENGANVFHGKERKNLFLLFLQQFLSPLIFLLLAAAAVTAVLREWVNTAVILFSLFLNVGLAFFHEYHAENTLDKLKSYIKERARVSREGREEEIDSSLIVPGDLIKLSYGFRVPADARIISSNSLNVDEAILTGESTPVEKGESVFAITTPVAERGNIVHSGTLVVEGYATAVVFATGDFTEVGKIAGIVRRTDRTETPLRKGMSHLAWLIFSLAIFIVAGIFILGVSKGEGIFPMLVLSAAVGVGAVPEALPIALTIILAIGATRIANKKGIVRKLTAAETLGSTTVIMTDKTGTLTLADMRLVGIYGKEELLKEEFHKEDQKFFSQSQKNLLQTALYNLDVVVENKDEEGKKRSFKGKPFEVNIAKACALHGVPLGSLGSQNPHIVLPFNSTNKFSVSLHGETYTVMGAPDILLKRANVSKEEYLRLESWIETTSKAGKRLIAVGSIGRKKHTKKNILPEKVNGINFLGLFVFHDPLRPEIPQAIRNIESHGAKVVLVTGDLKGTAVSVAESLGWKVAEGEVMTGGDLNDLPDEELLAILPKIKIFSRVTPEDKLRIGRMYQKLGEVVAMTGDGVNDAPALKAMDVGISLGSATDVAKSAADIVLLDDNFKTISLAIDEGRKILSNVRKAIVYLLSNSLDEIFVIGGSLLAGLPLPITALQIIWVNLFTGSLPALAFAFDEGTDGVKYRGKDLKLIFSKEVKVLALGVGVLSSVLLFLLYYFLVKTGMEPQLARSVFFVCFSSYILVISFCFRSLHKSVFSYDVFSNRKLNWSIILAFALLVLTLSTPFMRNIFEIAPMPLSWVPFVALWLAINVLLVEGAKYFFRLKKPR